MKPDRSSSARRFDLRAVFTRPEVAGAVLAFALGLVLTLSAWAWVKAGNRSIAEERLNNRAREAAHAIHVRLGAFEALLHGAAALFASSSNVTRDEWRAYVQALGVDSRYPGIAALAYAEHVAAANKNRHEARTRKQGLPSYAIMPPGQRDDYVPVIFTEFFGGSEAPGVGFDMLTEASLHQAMIKARDNAAAEMSGAVLLGQESGQHSRREAGNPRQTGVVLYLPVYRRNLAIATVEQRRAALAGYVYAAIRFDELAPAILGGASAIQLEIYEGDEVSAATRMYRNVPADQSHELAAATARVAIDGRAWTLRLSSTPQFEAGIDRGNSRRALIAGLLASALLAAAVWFLMSRRSKLADHRWLAPLLRSMLVPTGAGVAPARPSSMRWKDIFERADWGMAMISEGRLQAVNASYADMHGYAIHELLGRPLAIVVAPETADIELPDRLAPGAGSGSRTFESTHVKKDGTRFPVLVDISAVKNDADEVIYHAVKVQDINARKLIEQRLVESTQSLKLVMESARIGTWELDFESGDVLNSVVLYRMFGYGEALPDWNYDLFLRHVHADDREAVNAGFEGAMKGADLWDFECRIVRAGGSEGWIWGRGNLKRNQAGEAARLAILIGDITERRQAEDEVRRLNAELEQRVSERTAQFEAANRQIERDYSNIELLSEMSSLLQSCSTSDEAFDVIRSYCAKLFTGQAGALYLIDESRKYLMCEASWGDDTFDLLSADQCWALRRGQVHQAQDSAADPICEHVRALHPPPDAPPPYLCIPMTAHNEILGLFHVEFTRSDEAGLPAPADRPFIITWSEQISLALANLRLRESLREQSIRDPLTGLFNRRYMQEAFRQEISRAERKGITLSIVMLDVDHFKLLNDRFGHDAGDVVLKQIAELLQSQIRGADIACRFGGEEFVLLLYESPLEAVRQRAEKICRAVRGLQLVHKNAPLGTLTISLGIAAFPKHGKTVEILLVAADTALYAAKHGGRDRVAVSGEPEGRQP